MQNDSGGNLVVSASTLQKIVKERDCLEEMCVELQEELLWESYYKGSKLPDGRWTHNFMSDGEWVARECGFDQSLGYYIAKDIETAIPLAAQRLMERGVMQWKE